MDITPFKLEDEAFWASSDRGSDKLARDFVGEYEGVLVDAPKQIPIDKRHTFPAAVYHMGKIRKVAVAPFDKHGVVTAMNVTANRLYVATGMAFQMDTDIIERPPVNPEKLGEGSSSTTESIELRRAMQIPWQPASYILTALLRDQVSNRAAVEMCQSHSCYVDPEVVKYQEAERAKINPSATYPPPGNPLPSYRKLADSPAIPDEPGMNLAITRLAHRRLDQPWVLQGAFRLNALPEEMVKPGWTDPNYAQNLASGKPAAVITVWILLTGANDGSPQVFPLRVPVWTKAGTAFTGYFSLNLHELRGAPRTAQTYFLYAFSGPSMAGPLPTALVGMR